MLFITYSGISFSTIQCYTLLPLPSSGRGSFNGRFGSFHNVFQRYADQVDQAWPGTGWLSHDCSRLSHDHCEADSVLPVSLSVDPGNYFLLVSLVIWRMLKPFHSDHPANPRHTTSVARLHVFHHLRWRTSVKACTWPVFSFLPWASSILSSQGIIGSRITTCFVARYIWWWCLISMWW